MGKAFSSMIERAKTSASQKVGEEGQDLKAKPLLSQKG